MVIFTIALPPDRVPYVNPNDIEACNELASELAAHFAHSIQAQPELRAIARRFVSGKHVCFVTLHTEEALLTGPSRS